MDKDKIDTLMAIILHCVMEDKTISDDYKFKIEQDRSCEKIKLYECSQIEIEAFLTSLYKLLVERDNKEGRKLFEKLYNHPKDRPYALKDEFRNMSLKGKIKIVRFENYSKITPYSFEAKEEPSAVKEHNNILMNIMNTSFNYIDLNLTQNGLENHIIGNKNIYKLF